MENPWEIALSISNILAMKVIVMLQTVKTQKYRLGSCSNLFWIPSTPGSPASAVCVIYFSFTFSLSFPPKRKEKSWKCLLHFLKRFFLLYLLCPPRGDPIPSFFFLGRPFLVTMYVPQPLLDPPSPAKKNHASQGGVGGPLGSVVVVHREEASVPPDPPLWY